MRKPARKKVVQLVPLKKDQPFSFINPEGKRLTVELLRQFPGHEHLSEERLEEILYSIKSFAGTLLDIAGQIQSAKPIAPTISIAPSIQKAA